MTQTPTRDQFQVVQTAQVRASATNPRKRFDETKLQELADSIRKHGQMQPIVVRFCPLTADDANSQAPYEIVAGERRWRACQLAGIETVQAIVRDIGDSELLELQIVENVQRVDMDPLDESDAFHKFVESRKDLTLPDAAAEISKLIGKTVEFVYQRLRLSDLSPEARELLTGGFLLLGHAVELSRLPKDVQESTITRMCFDEKWNEGKRVRDPKSLHFSTWTVSNLRRQVRDDFKIHRLVDMPWNTEDSTFKQCVACVACPKRTGANASLFGETNEIDTCLDVACYNKKLDQHLKRRIAANHGQGKQVVLLDPRQESYNYKPKQRLGVPVYPRSLMQKSDSETGTVAIICNSSFYANEKMGLEVYVTLDQSAINRADGKANSASQVDEGFEQRKEAWRKDSLNLFRSKIRSGLVDSINTAEMDTLVSAQVKELLESMNGKTNWPQIREALSLAPDAKYEWFEDNASVRQLLQILTLKRLWWEIQPAHYGGALSVSTGSRSFLNSIGLGEKVIADYKKDVLTELPKPIDPKKQKKPDKEAIDEAKAV